MTLSWEIKGFLETKNDHLHIDGIDVVKLAQEHSTPLFVFSESRIRHNIDRLRKVENAIPRPLKICYAAKAMSTMGILGAVKKAGIDIEVNSGGELWKALKADFTGDQIIFNGTSKEIWELEMAIDAGIYAIQVDSLYELGLIDQTAQRLDKKANVSLRLVPEIESGTHSGLQTALLTSKFGMMPDEAFRAFREKNDSSHLNLCGIHLHIGSQNPDPKVYSEALKSLFDEMLRIYDETGVKLKHINLGGGFPVNYLSEDAPQFPRSQREMFAADFEPEAAIANAWHTLATSPYFDTYRHLLGDLTILIEPGRSIIADAGVCLTTVRNAKNRPTAERSAGVSPAVLRASRPHTEATAGRHHDDRRDAGATDRWLLTDAGFNILLSMETYKWYYHLISATRASEHHETPYKVAGPLCDGGDVYFDIEGEKRLPDHRLLPENVGSGEVLALLNCGAYSLAQASQYNGRALPPVVLISTDRKPELIRRRDSFEDLIASDIYQ